MMFRYTLTREVPGNDFGGYTVFTEIETKDLKEVKQRLKELKIDDDLIKKINEETEQTYQNFVKELKSQNLPEENILPVIYSPFLYRKSLFDPENPPDEMPFLEIKYYPVKELLKLIEKETGKQITFPYPEQKIRAVKSPKQVMLLQYSPEKKNYKNLFSYTLSRTNSDRVYTLLKQLETLFNDYLE